MNRWSLIGREESGQCVLVSIATANTLVLNGMYMKAMKRTISVHSPYVPAADHVRID